MTEQAELHDDLLEGADAIAQFLFGDKTKRRRVYHLMDRLPVFRLGNSVCARKSSLISMIKYQENLSDILPQGTVRRD
jgi:hypothetical protein